MTDRDNSKNSADDHPTQIGAYRILDVLGEGGMAVVYLAEQSEPVKRRVALKIVKLGMDSKQVVARFESERQALAVLNHPNIAQVFDGGITEAGRPYFVMERVHGTPITEFCDDHRLSTNERVSLFASVCSAVQHAHQKGLIHRDLKPSNILVGMIDGGPQVKIIDFGIAKATSANLTDKTLFTRIGQIIGTPQYMSPEQADITGLDVDTRTDIYSLGVILYEMLVGVVPLDLTAVTDRAMKSALIEKDAPKPSTRITELGDTQSEIAKARGTDPDALRRQLKGDLDWIVMKAIDKNRARRYETANALSVECERFLNHEPVVARPPSTGYLLRRFVRRNRVGVIAGSVALLAIIGGGVAATIAFVQANQARLEMEEVVTFLTDIFEVSDPDENKGNTITAREILDRASERAHRELEMQPVTRARMLATIGDVYQALGLVEPAQFHLQEAYEIRLAELGEEHEDTLYALDSLTALALFRSEYEKMDAYAKESLRIHRKLYGDDHPRTIGALSDLGVAQSYVTDAAAAVRYSREALEAARRSSEVTDEELEVYVRRLAIYLDDIGEADEAEALYKGSLRMCRDLYGEIHSRTAFAIDNLAIHYDINGDYDRAEPLYRQVISILYTVFGEEHPEIAQSLGNVGGFLVTAKGATGHNVEVDLEEARTMLTKALDMNRRTRPGHQNVGENLGNLAALETLERNYAEAEKLYREALEAYAISLPDKHHRMTSIKADLGRTLLLRNEPDDAESFLLDAEQNFDNPAIDDETKTEVRQALLEIYQARGDQPKIDEYARKLEDI